MIGIDTGFIYALWENDPQAVRVFRESDIAVSVLNLFELRRIALRRNLPWKDLSAPLLSIAAVAEITREVADRASFISYGTGLPAIDALIIASLQALGCRKIYSRDEHFRKYSSKDVEIVIA